jgi:hypothetical protein
MGPIKIRLVSMTGSVRTLADIRRSDFGHLPVLTKPTPRPWDGPKDGPWQCFFWDGDNYRIWCLGADGSLVPFSGQTVKDFSRWAAEDGSRDSAVFGWVDGMAADRQGNLYVSEHRLVSEHSTGGQALRQVAPDGSVTTLCASSRDSAPGVQVPGFIRMFLDEPSQVLYGLTDEPTRFGTFSIKDRTFTDLGDAKGLMPPFGLYRGCLILKGPRQSATSPLGYLAINLRTGERTPIFEDSDHKQAKAGPCFGIIPGMAKGECGSLGRDNTCMAMGADGQICADDEHGHLALLLLDWDDPRLGLAPAAAARQGTKETKDPR